MDGVAAYVYDGEGNRVRKLVGENIRMVYGITGGLLAEFDPASGELKKEYIYGASGLAATIAAGEGTRYVTADHLGSPRIITSTTGAVISRHDNQPFGEELFVVMGSRTSAQGYGVMDGLRKQFTGYERDNETGLDYAKARYYANMQGRFTSPDPLLSSGLTEQPQSWNRYTYVINNPLKYTDPTGLIWGHYQGNNGQWYYQWFEDKKTLEASGATVVTSFIVQNPAGEWLRFDPESNHYDVFKSANAARENTHGPLGDQSTITDQAFSYAAGSLSGRIAAHVTKRVFGSVLSSVFARGADEAIEDGGLAIGKLTDLAEPGAVRAGERSLGWANKGSYKSNWLENSSLLRQEMSLGKPIRDISVNRVNGALRNNTGFLRAERNILESHGWQYNPRTTMWHPPKP